MSYDTRELMEDEIVSLMTDHYEPIIQDAIRVQNETTVQDRQNLWQREDIIEQNCNARYRSGFDNISSCRKT